MGSESGTGRNVGPSLSFRSHPHPHLVLFSTDVRLPQSMQRSMAAEAEASREARAKVIAAEGEQKASRQLKEAADVMASSPIALQLRYLQTLTQIAAEKNSTIIFPVPGACAECEWMISLHHSLFFSGSASNGQKRPLNTFSRRMMLDFAWYAYTIHQYA